MPCCVAFDSAFQRVSAAKKPFEKSKNQKASTYLYPNTEFTNNLQVGVQSYCTGKVIILICSGGTSRKAQHVVGVVKKRSFTRLFAAKAVAAILRSDAILLVQGGLKGIPKHPTHKA